MKLHTPTLNDRIWDNHVVATENAMASAPDTLYIDLQLLHEVTSPQAFTMLRERGLKVRRPNQCIATMDHSTPTTPIANNGKYLFASAENQAQVQQLENNCADFSVPLFPLGHEHQGIVHVIAPELGMVHPGMTIVCGDSHTSTHGAFGALAFGIGTGQVGHVLATQCLLAHRPRSFKVEVSGTLGYGVSAKDVILALIAKIGTEGGTGHVFEFTGKAIRNMSMERLTLCNMAIEGGACAALVAPDDTTFSYLAGRPFAPQGQAWEIALSEWQKMVSHPETDFDRSIQMDGTTLEPMVTFGTSPGMAIPVSGLVPDPSSFADAAAQQSLKKALDYMQVKAGQPMKGHPVDVVFVGSCTNGRLSDLQDAAKLMRGRKVHDGIRMLVVPGSHKVKNAAEAEGLHEVFENAGAEWREPGCSMCLAMNGDKIEPGQLAVSTSNRNFEGRQGPGGRTVLASPLTAAACAVTGKITDVREMI